MNVLVTGASGLIGRSTVQALLRRGHHLTTLYRGAALEGLEAAHVAADVRAPAARAAARQAEAIVHLAGLGDVDSSFQHPLEYNEVNAGGTLNLLEGVREGGGLLVLASTQRLYRLSPRPIPEDGALEPQSPYAYSKLVAESYCQQYAHLFGVRALVLRFFSVYGPGQQGRGSSGVVAIFLERALAGLPLAVHSHMRRDFTHVHDVARGIALALERPWSPGAVYNVATGVGTSLLELAELVRELAGAEVSIEAPPAGGQDGPHLVADCTRARRDLGYEPGLTLREGLRSWLHWRRERG
ncbi:MAG: NAD-dependent epimerase/dehydratase family protein [Chloroflexi bacterium]|nr:NAD-dependent epimerase/dehydratase family protein [Chloroflexota bacterium]